MVQVSRRPMCADSWVQNQTGLCRSCAGKVGKGTVLSPLQPKRTSVFSFQYKSTCAPQCRTQEFFRGVLKGSVNLLAPELGI
jgi:hypothetical protein